MKPIILNLKHSLILSVIFIAVSVLFISCILLSPIQLYYQLGLIALILLALIYNICLHALLVLPNSIVELGIINDGFSYFKSKRGDQVVVTIAGDTFVHPVLTIIYYKVNLLFGQSVLITPDRVNAEQFRALRVWLLWYQTKGDRVPNSA